jgi:hypothetical protein
MNGKFVICVSTFGGPCLATIHTSEPRSPAPCKKKISGQRARLRDGKMLGGLAATGTGGGWIFNRAACAEREQQR